MFILISLIKYMWFFFLFSKELSVCSMSSGVSESSGSGSGSGGIPLGNRDFKIALDMKSGGQPISIHLVAPTMQVAHAY